MIAALVVDAIKTNRLYIFPHFQERAVLDARAQRILTGFDETAAALERLGLEVPITVHK